MIKVEKLLNDCKAFINSTDQLQLGQLITSSEFETMSVHSGSITVSVDEKELITISAKVEVVTPPTAKEVSLNTEETVLQAKSPELTQPEAKEIEVIVKPTTKVAKSKAK